MRVCVCVSVHLDKDVPKWETCLSLLPFAVNMYKTLSAVGRVSNPGNDVIVQTNMYKFNVIKS